MRDPLRAGGLERPHGTLRLGLCPLCERRRHAQLCYTLPLFGAEEKEIRLQADPLTLTLPKDTELKLQTELPPFVLAPVRAGEIGGCVHVCRDGVELGRVPLRVTQTLGETGKNT